MKFNRIVCMVGSLSLAVGMCASNAVAEEVLVGVQLPMTGAVSSWAGPPIKRGVDLAVQHVNTEKLLGAGRTLKIVMGDDASDKAQAIALTSQFINQDKVAMMIGPATSPLAGAAAPPANEAGLPTIALAVSKKVTATGKWIFKIYQNPEALMTAAAEYTVQKYKPSSVTLIFSRDNDALVSYKDLLRGYFKSHGVTKIYEESVLSSDSDFSALATKVAYRPTDIVYLGTTPESAANIAIQARRAGLPATSRFMGSDEMGAPNFVKIGGKATDGTVYPTFFFPDRSKKQIDQFVSEYQKAYGTEPDQYSAVGYASVLVAADAIRAAGPNAAPEKVQAALANLHDIPTVLGNGDFSFDKDRNPHYGVVMLKIEGGKSVLNK
jgi:branched-chain amino acid transport system substrate-binding protein